ncbi:MAG: hypothetical protein U9R60_10970 [Bacteroidota bacterium]|nr:hypothetical protein [Bacteroidota bacterium]
MRKTLYAFLCLTIIISFACKREDDAPNYGEYSTPAFEVYQETGNLEHLFARCISEDVELDTVIVTDPLNIKYMRYFQGQVFQKDVQIDLGDTFIPTQGEWSFIFRGTKVVSGNRYSAYIAHSF